MMNDTINIEEKGRDQSVRKNIPLDFLYRFLSCFDIAGTIWVLYMVYRGLPLWQIGLVEGVFHVASFLFEVPSGALADLLGRKYVIAAGRVCAALSSLMILGGRNVVHFMAAFVVTAIGYNLNSGSEEAFVYDSLKEDGREHRFQQINGRLEVITEIASAVGVFVGGVLAEHSFVWCYIASFVVAALSLLPVLFFREPGRGGERAADAQSEHDKENRGWAVTLRTHARTCAAILRENRAVRRVLLYYPALAAFEMVMFYYGQEFFSQMGLNWCRLAARF